MELTSDLGHGMMVSGSSNCLITGVNTTGDIFLEGSNNNIITRNTASFYIWTSSNNAVYQNNIESHLIVNASNNIFYDNNVLFHVPPDIVGHNSWNNSDVGNYWGNYSSQGEYMIGKNNIDYHPFAQQVNTSGSAPTPPPFPSATQYISDYIAPIIIIIILIAFVTSILFYRKRQTRKTATT
jgi:hypothetical protein